MPVGSFFRRLLYALHFREANFLLSDVFNDNSKLIYVRNPRERVEKVAPFLTLDGDPYPAVVNGRVDLDPRRLHHVGDLPVLAAGRPARRRPRTPTSGTGTVLQAKQNINYIRNSVKATVDAYDGTVTLYEFDDNDPILKAWNKAFGGNLIKPQSAIPAELAAHFRYPEDLFKVQRDLLAKFHVTDPQAVLLRRRTSGRCRTTRPQHRTRGAQAAAVLPAHPVPGQDRAAFQLTAALTPSSRQNLAALITGSYVDGKPQAASCSSCPATPEYPGRARRSRRWPTTAMRDQQITLLKGRATGPGRVRQPALAAVRRRHALRAAGVREESAGRTRIPLMRLVLRRLRQYRSASADTLPTRDQATCVEQRRPRRTPPSSNSPTQPGQTARRRGGRRWRRLNKAMTT